MGEDGEIPAIARVTPVSRDAEIESTAVSATSTATQQSKIKVGKPPLPTKSAPKTAVKKQKGKVSQGK